MAMEAIMKKITSRRRSKRVPCITKYHTARVTSSTAVP
jgi:hypothetical protein